MDAMVRLRGQKAQEEQFKARQEAAMYQSLGEGVGGLLGGLGKNMESSQNDALANQLRNRQSPPRAMAVNQALQGPADTAAASMPGGPMTEGGPFTGGVKGLQIQGMLDKTAMAEERLRNQGELTTAKISDYASRATARDTESALSQSELALKQEKEARLQQAADHKRQQDEVDAAIKLEKQATDKYKGTLSDVRAWNAGYKPLMSSAAGAKTQEEYDKAVSAITTHYQVGQNMGFKGVAYPEIPQPAFMRNTDAATQLQQLQANKGWFGTGIGAPSAADIAAKQQEVQSSSYMPQIQDYNLQPEPQEPSRDFHDYMPQQQPSQQGGGAAAPAGGGEQKTMSLDEAKKINPAAVSGKYLKTPQGYFLIQ